MDFHQLIVDEHQSHGAAVPIDLRAAACFPNFYYLTNPAF